MNIEKYAKISPQYYNYDVPELLKKYLNLKSYTTLLDCGCGDGSLLYALKVSGLLRKAKTIKAIDFSKNRIALARKISNQIKAKVDNAESMKTVKSDSVDLFISTQVIEHVDDKKMVNSIHRITKTNGIIYISTVFKKWYGWYFYRNQGRWVLDPTHLREYSKDKELLSLFDKRKFKLLENKKTLQWFSILHFFLRRLNIANRKVFSNFFFNFLGKLKIPILGYYNWEIVFKKL